MNITSQKFWLPVVVSFAVIVVTMVFSPLVLTPWHNIPVLYGDGGKNIFTYLYHILHGRGMWFSGMNFPYGEHIVYTDGQALLSVPLSYVKGITVGQALTVLWWLLAFSHVLAIVFVFKILTHFKVPPLLAMVFSGIICLFSPQVFALQGHYGLAYACVTPMLFYWLIKYRDHPSWKYVTYIFLLGTISSFLHPYYSGLIAVFTGVYALGHLITGKSPISFRLQHVWPLLTGIALQFLAIGIIMKSTDPVKDRPAAPYGTLAYGTTGEKIFTSPHSPVWQYIQAHIPSVSVCGGGEGCSYPGLVVLAIVIISVVTGIRNKLNKKTGDITAGGESYPAVWLFVAGITLLFSMGVPFVWNMEWLLDYLSFFRQFRTLDRFSWIFYFIITVYAVVTLCRWYSRLMAKGRKAAAYILMVVAIGIWVFEESGYVAYEQKSLNEGYGNYDALMGNKNNNWNAFLKAHNHIATDFQALLIVHFFNVGTDKLWLGGAWGELGISIGTVAGMQLQLPIVDAMMARSSWSQAGKQVKTVAGPFVHKPLLDGIGSEQPFLLLHMDNEPLYADQKYLLSSSDSIGHFEGCYVYACYPSRLRASDRKYADSVSRLIPFLPEADTFINKTGTCYINHFDKFIVAQPFFGAGALPQIHLLDTLIAQIPLAPDTVSREYELSCWFLLGSENYSSPFFKISIIDNKGNEVAGMNALTKESTDNNGLWYRCFLSFVMPPNCKTLLCTLQNEPDNSYRIMDELMLRPASTLVVSKDGKGHIMVNNHLFRAAESK